jgi:type II secretion system protein I
MEQQNKGFTLIEVLVSVGIVATVFLTLITLQMQNLRAMKKSEETLVALMLVQKSSVEKSLEEKNIELEPYLEEKVEGFEIESEEFEISGDILTLITEGLNIPSIRGISGIRIKTPDGTKLDFFAR